MNSEQSSFREIYQFPAFESKRLKNRTRHLKKRTVADVEFKPESFDKFVRKTKNVVMFAQKLKQQIAQKRIFDMHTLTEKEIGYMQNQPSQPSLITIFSYDNKIIQAVQALFAVVLLIFAWKNSIEAIFTHGPIMPTVNFILLFLYPLQVFLFCFTEHKNQRQQILNNRSLIWQIYIEQYCFKDVACILIIALQAAQIGLRLNLFSLFVILRVISTILTIDRMRDSVAKLQSRLTLSTNAETILEVMKLVFKIFMFLHFLSIILNILVDIETYMGQSQTWISSFSDQIKKDLDRYILGWYWAATILSTVGFGDITPKNNTERFLISFMQILCCMAFGYFVNVIGSLLRLRTERDQKYEKENRTLNRYLNSLMLSQDIKLKVRSHFINKHKIEKTYDSGQQKEVLNSLSLPLKCSLLEENNINILKKSSYLQKFNGQALIKMARHLKRVIFAPEHLIYSRDTSEQKLWFIESGAIEQFTDQFKGCSLRKKIAHYEKDDSTVGWARFLVSAKYNTQAIASKFTVAYELQQANLSDTLRRFPKDWYKWLQMRQLNIQNKKIYLQKCLSCDKYSHNVIECPRIHHIKRNAVSMIRQARLLERQKAESKGKKKYKRETIRDNWKRTFEGADSLKKTMAFHGQHEESSKALNMTIQHFIKNLTKIQSLKHLSNKRISAAQSKAEARDSKVEEWQIKQMHLIPCQKSIGSMEISEVVQDQVIFDRVLMDKDNTQYLTHHNISEVLNGCSRFNQKATEDNLSRLFQFRKKSDKL